MENLPKLETRKCQICKKDLSIDCFDKRGRGKSSICKTCHKDKIHSIEDFYKELPEEFKRNETDKLNYPTRTITDFLNTLVYSGKLEQPRFGYYKKINSISNNEELSNLVNKAADTIDNISNNLMEEDKTGNRILTFSVPQGVKRVIYEF